VSVCGHRYLADKQNAGLMITHPSKFVKFLSMRRFLIG